MGRLARIGLGAGWPLALLCALIWPLLSWAQESPPPEQVELPVAAQSPVDDPQQERIRFWDIDLQLLPDGSLRVTEKITVWAQHLQFKNGIYRDLGGSYFDLYSGMKSAEPKVLSASLNGVPVRFRLETVASGTRVHIGENSTALGPGQHDFELHYEIPHRVVTTLASSLEWTLDGEWQVPVDQTQISIHLPSGVDRSSVQIKGSPRAQIELPASGPLWVVADGRMWPGEQLSFELSFRPAAEHAQSQWSERWRNLPTGHRWAFAGLVALWSYFLIVWVRVGKDPPPGPRTVSFAPPEGISPGGLRMIERLRYDPDCLVADLIALATAGQLRIERDAAGITLYRDADSAPTLMPLAKLKAALFDRSDSLRLTRSNGSRLRQAVSRHRQALLAVHERQHFVSNFRYWWPGLLIALLTFATLILLQDNLEAVAIGAFMTVWLSGWSFGVYVLISQAWMLWRGAESWGGHAGALFMTLFSIPFVAGEIFGLMLFTATTGLVGLAVILVALIALIGFYHWLKSPTAAGRQLLDQVEGLREHLHQFDPWGQNGGEIDWMIGYAYALGESGAMAKRLRQKLNEVGRFDTGPGWFRDATGRVAELSDIVDRLGQWLSKSLGEGLAKRG